MKKELVELWEKRIENINKTLRDVEFSIVEKNVCHRFSFGRVKDTAETALRNNDDSKNLVLDCLCIWYRKDSVATITFAISFKSDFVDRISTIPRENIEIVDSENDIVCQEKEIGTVVMEMV